MISIRNGWPRCKNVFESRLKDPRGRSSAGNPSLATAHDIPALLAPASRSATHQSCPSSLHCVWARLAILYHCPSFQYSSYHEVSSKTCFLDISPSPWKPNNSSDLRRPVSLLNLSIMKDIQMVYLIKAKNLSVTRQMLTFENFLFPDQMKSPPPVKIGRTQT